MSYRIPCLEHLFRGCSSAPDSKAIQINCSIKYLYSPLNTKEGYRQNILENVRLIFRGREAFHLVKVLIEGTKGREASFLGGKFGAEVAKERNT